MSLVGHRRFLAALSVRDWDALAEVAGPNMDWHGPAGDRTRRGRDYVDRLRGSIGTFETYGLEVVREVAQGPLVMVELVQRFRSGGEDKVVPEVMVFDLDPATDTVRRLSVYVRGADKD